MDATATSRCSHRAPTRPCCLLAAAIGDSVVSDVSIDQRQRHHDGGWLMLDGKWMLIATSCGGQKMWGRGHVQKSALVGFRTVSSSSSLLDDGWVMAMADG